MAFVLGRIRTPLAEEAYQARMSDFHMEERKGRRAACHVCQDEMPVGLLKSHLATQHDVYQCFVAPDADQAGSRNEMTWTAHFYLAKGTYRCPVPNCLQGQGVMECKSSFNLCCHFACRHPAWAEFVFPSAPAAGCK